MAGKDISDMSFDEFFGKGGSKKKDEPKAVVESHVEQSPTVIDRSGFPSGRPKLNVHGGQISLYVPKYNGGRGAKYEVSIEQDGRSVNLGRLKTSPLNSDVSSLPTEFDILGNGISPLRAFILYIDGKAVYDMFEHSHLMFSAEGMPISRAEDITVVLYSAGKHLWMTDAKLSATMEIGDMRIDTVEVAPGGYVRVRDRPQPVERPKGEAVKTEEVARKPKVKPAVRISMSAADPSISVMSGKSTLPLYASFPTMAFDVKGVDEADCIVRTEIGDSVTECPIPEFDITACSDNSGQVRISVMSGGKALATESFFVIPGFSCSYSGHGDIPSDPQVTFTMGGVDYVRDIFADGLDGPYGFGDGEIRLRCNIPVVTYDVGNGEVPFAESEIQVDDLPDSIVIKVTGATKKSIFLAGTGKKVNLTPDWDDDLIRLDSNPIRKAVFDSDSRSAALYITVNSCPVRRFLTITNQSGVDVNLSGGALSVTVRGSGAYVCRVFNIDRSVDSIDLTVGENTIPLGSGAITADVVEIRDGKEIHTESVMIKEIPFLLRDSMGDVWFHVSKDKRIPLPDGLLSKGPAEIRAWHSQIVRMNPELRAVSPEKTVKAFKDFGSL